MQEQTRKLIMIMVDGFGVPPEGWNKSVYAKYGSSAFAELFREYSIPLDACLGVEGLPQSATGQTALFTGINAAKVAGRHISGFPGPSLKEILRQNNIFLELIRRGKSVMFANSYARYPFKKLLDTRFASVTSIMLSTFSDRALDADDLIKGEAVLHDITRKVLAETHHLPLITPKEGARHLLNVSAKYDFVLFEYFMTDKAGHSGIEDDLRLTLSNLSDFLLTLAQNLPPHTGLLLCSDHGNCEDTSTMMHTVNKVPLLFLNMERPHPEPQTITDVYNAALRYFEDKTL